MARRRARAGDPERLTAAERNRLLELWLRVPVDAGPEDPAVRTLVGFLHDLAWGPRDFSVAALAYYALREGGWRTASRQVERLLEDGRA